MALEYVVAGRRVLPRSTRRVWSTSIEQGSDALNEEESDEEESDEEEDTFDEGSCEIDEMRLDDTEYVAFVTQRAGFVPASIVSIRPAGWDFSQAAAEVIAAALDGVYFCDGIEDDGPSRPFETATAASTIADLELRLNEALRQPLKYFTAWAKAEALAQAEADRRDPSAAASRAKDNDWSDL